jgi:S1-C subfamily serine protease
MAEDATECKLGRVTRNGPADQAGVKAGDVITRFAGREVGSYDEMVTLLKEQKPYAVVPVEVKRGDEVKELKVTVGFRPND